VPGDDGGAAVRVLIVEDDQRVRAALRRFLSASAGFEVVAAAADPHAALRMARELAPAVALVDVLLPEAGDGLGLLRALTGELSIPAVAISMRGGLRVGALAAGACRFLPKDGAPDLLLAALRAAVPDGGRGTA
jgi:DNA-binding NarL/FixJ family response regulator